MLIPLSWLKEYVDIKLPFAELAAKLSEVGLTVEKWDENPPAGGGDIIFDPEVTPNRPDWLSVYGIAREISAITGSPLKKQMQGKSLTNPSKSQYLEIKIKPNYKIVPRITSVIIKNVKVKPSPQWLQNRIKQIGLRPINNLVDITNYVLWCHGSLLHVFDYDKIRGHQMTVELSKGGEAFRSLDGIDYTLPKDAIIIKDVGRVIDLLPLKGGENTASFSDTKNVLLHSVVVDPILTRHTSQALGLRSDSSAIAERGLDPNGTIIAVNHAASLILELAGGEMASEIMDHKAVGFLPSKLELNLSHLENVIGIKFDQKEVETHFERLGLNPVAKKSGNEIIITTTIPTFRHDLKGEEDLIEEAARLHGYNSIPKTLPFAPTPTNVVAYAKDYDLDFSVKQKMTACGYSEINTYSLISEKQLIDLGISPEKTLRIDNPISRDFEYLRPNLFGNFLDAIKQNIPNFSEVKLFELGKRYQGPTLDKITEEYWICAGQTGQKFFETKGVVESLLNSLGVSHSLRPAISKDGLDWFHPGRVATIENKKGEHLGVVGEIHPSILSKWGIKQHITVFKINYDLAIKSRTQSQKYQPIPKYPAVIEDISLAVPNNILVGEIIETIKKSSHLVQSVDLLDTHESSKTFRITYLDRNKNLSQKEVAEVQSKILSLLKEKLSVKLK